jgi:hypothetical protein
VAKKKKIALSPDESALLKGLLSNPDAIDLENIRDALAGTNVAQVFLEKLPSDNPDLIPLIVAVRDAFPEKAVQKALRRKVFLLEQRGLHVPDPREKDEGGGILRDVSGEDKPFSFMTPYDVLGMKSLVYGIPRPPRGFELGFAFISHETGIQQFASAHISKKKTMAARSEFLEEFRNTVDISLGHAVSLLEESYQTDKVSAGSSDYLSARPRLLNQVSLPETHPVYDLIPEEEVSGLALTGSMVDRLFENELFTPWILDPSEFNQTADEIREATDSPLHLSDEQLENRIRDIKQKTVQDFFTEPKRRNIKRRLEETAFHLHRTDDTETARLALVAASSLKEKDTIFEANPFLTELVERTLDLLLEDMEDIEDEHAALSTEEEEESPSGLIIP